MESRKKFVWHRARTYGSRPMGYASLIISVSLALTLPAGRAVANWYGQNVGSGICTPIDHIRIGSDGAATVIHGPGNLRTPEDFANALLRFGLMLKLQPTTDPKNLQIYSAIDGNSHYDFKFFTNKKTCLGDANALLDSPSSAGQPAPSSPLIASPKTRDPIAATPAASVATAAVPLSPPLSLLPQAAAVPIPAKIWIITVLFGNDPMGAPLSRFYRTKQACIVGIATAEHDPLVRGATANGRFKLDCLQLTEAGQHIDQIDPARFRERRVFKRHPHQTQPPAAFEAPTLSNEPPPSERSFSE